MIEASGYTVSEVNTQFNSLKTILAGCLSITYGTIVTFTKRKFSKTARGDYNLKQLVIPYFLYLLGVVLCIAGIERSDGLAGMWILFVAFGLVNAGTFFYLVNEGFKKSFATQE